MIFILQAIIRDVCSSVNEQFMHLVAQEEERRRQAREAAALSQTPVRSKMLKRISRVATDQITSSSSAAGGVAVKKGKKLGRKFLKRQSPRGQNTGGQGTVDKRNRMRSSVEERADSDFILLPLNTSDVSDRSGDGTGPSSEGNEGVVEEIGRQFSAISKMPSRRAGGHPRGPKLKRLSKTEQSSLSKRMLSLNIPSGGDSLASSVTELLPPLNITRPVSRHDGNVITQELESTEGVQLPDIHDLLSGRSKTRLPLGPESFPTSASTSEHMLDRMESSPHLSLDRTATGRSVTSTGAPLRLSPLLITPSHTTHSPPPPTPPPPVTPPLVSQPTPDGGEVGEEEPATEDTPTKHRSRTSQLLETMVDGEVETT